MINSTPEMSDFFSVFENNDTSYKFSYTHYYFQLTETSDNSNVCQIFFECNNKLVKTFSNVLLKV